MKEEKYIKEILIDYDSPLDLGASWSLLDQALDQEATATNTPTEKETFSLRKYLPLMIFILISGCGIFAYKNLDKSILPFSQKSSETVPVHMVDTDNSKEKSEIINKSNSSEKKSAATKLEVADKASQNAVSKFESPTTESSKQRSVESKNTTQNNIVNNSTITTPLVNQKNSTNKIFNAKKANTTIQDIENFPLAENKNRGAEIVSNNPKTSLLNLNALASNPYYIGYDERIITPDFKLAKLPRQRRVIPQKPKGIRLGIHTGLSSSNISSIIIQSDLNATSSFERLINSTYGLQIEKVFPSGLKLSSGLNFIDQGYALQRVDTLEISEIELSSDTTVTGLTTAETVTIQRDVSFERKINVANLNTLQLPLMVGFEKKFSKFDLGLSVGTGINYILRNETGFEIPISNFTLSGLADIQVGYQLNDKFRIYSSLVGSRHFSQLETTFSINDMTNRLNHYGIRAGISYVL